MERIIKVGNLPRGGFESRNRVYSPKGISPTLLSSMGTGGGLVPMFLIIRRI